MSVHSFEEKGRLLVVSLNSLESECECEGENF